MRILAALLLAAAIPLLLFAAWAAYLRAQEERQNARESVTAITAAVAERVAGELRSELSAVEALGMSEALDAPDLERFLVEARRIVDERPLWETVSLIEPAGMQILNTLRPLGESRAHITDRDSFEEVVRTGNAAISGIGSPGPISGRRLVHLRVPTVRNGYLTHVLSVGLLPETVRLILRQAGAPESWVGVIVDRHGNIIARTSEAEGDVGRPGSAALRQAISLKERGLYAGRTLEGVDVETAFEKLKDAGGWSVHFSIPREALDRPVSHSLWALAGGGAASMILAAGLTLLIARDIQQRRADEAARAELALRASEERAAVAMNAADLAPFSWSPTNGRVTAAPRFAAFFGLTRRGSAMSGTWSQDDVTAQVHAQDRKALLDAISACAAEGASLDTEVRVTSDGSASWLRLTGRSGKGEDGIDGTVVGVAADISSRKRAEAERQELLRELSEVQEAEQRRIARELHDQVGQTVTGLSLGLKTLQGDLEHGSRKDALARIRWLQTLTDTIGRDIHQAAADLRPTALDDLGLERALRGRLNEWGARNGVEVELVVIGGLSLRGDVETTIYRVVQEALTNVLKHAQASAVTILLENRSNEVRAIIEDDGVGFDAEAPRASSRLGLSGMRERVALLGGSLEIESAPGSGTALYVSIPIQDEEAQ